MKSTQDQLVMPILSAGRHRSPRQGACFMEFASYLAGERWSDHPTCTHPLLAALARDVNDLSSDDARAGLTGLIHRVVGLTGDDPAITADIAARAAAAALPIVSMERQRALAAALINVVAQTNDPGLESVARDAFDQAPDSERWARHYLSTAPAPRDFGYRAAAAMVHTAVVGIALACVDDADALLTRLLRETIETTERAVRPIGSPDRTPASQVPALVR
jgi:hypothetical protein